MINLIAHIIHQPERTDRLQNILNQTAEQVIAYRHIYPIKDHSPVRSLTLTHRMLVREADTHNYPNILIMEDDVAFTAPGAFRHFLANMPEDFDIYTAGSYGHACKPYDWWENTVSIKNMSGTHCYVVNNRFYKKFLSMDYNMLIDRAISEAATTVKMCMPMTALQIPGYSDLKKCDVDYNREYIGFPLYHTSVENFCNKLPM